MQEVKKVQQMDRSVLISDKIPTNVKGLEKDFQIILDHHVEKIINKYWGILQKQSLGSSFTSTT